MVDRYSAHFLDVLQKADIRGDDGKLICYGMYDRCPPPPLPAGSLEFPKARPVNPAAPAHSGELVDVLHLSEYVYWIFRRILFWLLYCEVAAKLHLDCCSSLFFLFLFSLHSWHVDHEYSAGAEAQCDRPQCCRKYPGASAAPIRAASSWGDYNCDTPAKLAADMLTFIPKVSKAKFTIMTGDVPAHDVWLGTIESTQKVEQIAYEAMSSLSSKIYPTIGNHESFPAR